MCQALPFQMNGLCGKIQRPVNLIFESPSPSWRWWNSFLWPFFRRLVTLSRWDPCPSHCPNGRHDCPFFVQYGWAMTLALFVQCHITPCEIPPGDCISKHSHSIAPRVSEGNRSIAVCCKSWDPTTEDVTQKSIMTGEGNWDPRQPTRVTSMAMMISQTLMTAQTLMEKRFLHPWLFELKWLWVMPYLLSEDLKLLNIHSNIETKERETKHVEWPGNKCQSHLLTQT